jgi:hypothetical protein
VNWWRKSLALWPAHSSRSKLAARASRCRTPLQALARASQAERPSRSPPTASRCSCPSPERKVGRRQARLPDFAAHSTSSSSTSLMLGSAAFTLAMSARATSSSAGVGRMAPIVAVTLRGWSTEPRIRGAIPRADYIRTIRSTPVRGLRKCPWRFGRFLKASMLGFTLVSRSYYYLRRRSPAPPFPPDDRQAQGTGGYR